MASKNTKKSNSKLQFKKYVREVKFSEAIADHAADLLLGNGVDIKHPVKSGNDRLQEILKYNKYEQFFISNERDLSMDARTVATIDIVGGVPTWTIANANSVGAGASQVGKYMNNGVVAVVWKRITNSAGKYLVKEVWDKEKVVRSLVKGTQYVSLQGVNKKLRPDEVIHPLWEHGMGFLPVVEFKNLPAVHGKVRKDTFNSQHIQELANETLAKLNYDLDVNITKMAGQMDAQTWKDTLTAYGNLETAMTTPWIVPVDTANNNGDNVQATLVPIVANPQIKVYWDQYVSFKDEAFKLAGYTPQTEATVEKSAAEIKSQSKADAKTTKKKRTQRSGEIQELINKTILIDIAHGFGDVYGGAELDDANVIVEILENKVQDTKEDIENFVLQMDNDLLSHVEAIAYIRGVEINEAKKLYKAILKEKEENKPEPVAVPVVEEEVEQPQVEQVEEV